jgi:hypothetical protein
MKRLYPILFCLLLAGCAAVSPPSSQRLTQHAALKDEAGILMFVDVCLKRDTVGDDDFFVIENSRQGAAAVLKAVTDYFNENGLIVREKIVPFVCGALHDSENPPKRIAETLAGRFEIKTQPFDVDPVLEQDIQYISALQHIATFAYQSALLRNSADMEKVKAAAALIAARTHCSSLVYIGITGNSLSKGKLFAQGIGQFSVGFATGIATGAASGGVMLYAFPHGMKDAYQMTAGLLDMRSGALLKSNAVHGNGDPMNPEVISQRDAIDLLLREVVFSDIRNF